jgi:hypothetical protein
MSKEKFNQESHLRKKMAIEKKIELKTYYLKRWFLTHHRSLFEKRGKTNK